MANELNTIVESSLGGLAAGRTIATVRVVDDTGSSANASPTQIREMTGIDHSILTEQIVPGEFWVDFDGVRRQVYARTIQINFPSGCIKDPTHGMVINGAAYGLIRLLSIIEIKGCRVDNDFMADGSYAVNINDILTAKIRGGNWGKVLWFYGESYPTPCTITLNIKYTQL